MSQMPFTNVVLWPPSQLYPVAVAPVPMSQQPVMPQPMIPEARQGQQGRIRRQRPYRSGPIYFYDKDKPYFEFTNFSRHPIMFNGALYPTSEHLYQAHKFMVTRPDLAEHIRCCPTPRMALEEATRLRTYARRDWFEVNVGIMDLVLELKFTQHPLLADLLRRTGQRELLEASPYDAFWGIGRDGRGQNKLGKALMRLRDRL